MREPIQLVKRDLVNLEDLPTVTRETLEEIKRLCDMLDLSGAFNSLAVNDFETFLMNVEKIRLQIGKVDTRLGDVSNFITSYLQLKARDREEEIQRTAQLQAQQQQKQ